MMAWQMAQTACDLPFDRTLQLRPVTLNRISVVNTTRVFASGMVDNSVVVAAFKVAIGQMAISGDCAAKLYVFQNERSASTFGSKSKILP